MITSPLLRFAFAGLLIAVAAAGAGWFVSRSPESVPFRGLEIGIVEASEPVYVEVKAGDSAASIAARLASAGIIEDEGTFRLLARLTGHERTLAAGEYEFLPGTSALDAVTRIGTGLTSARLVTIPEGLRIEEIAALLERRGIVPARDFLAAAATYAPSEPSIIELLSQRSPGQSLEGYLFPATYSFPRQVTAPEVVEMMVSALDERFSPQLRAEAQAAGLTVAEVVNLASIVEREVIVSHDAPLVASVYLNRLREQMPLQADPTVQYAVASSSLSGFWKAELTLQDLRSASPYNTYVESGLPPGPIANPGLQSIQAVIRPAITDYLFFVARPDGSHVFSRTFEEHERNVNELLR